MKLQLLAVLLGSSIVGGALAASEPMSSDSLDKAKRITNAVGQAMGAATACENIAQQRINVITNRLTAEIGKLTRNSEEATGLRVAYDQGVFAGQGAASAKQISCLTASADFAYWGDPATMWLLVPSTPTVQIQSGVVAVSVDAASTVPSMSSTVLEKAPVSAGGAEAKSGATQVPNVRGVSDREIRMGMSAPLSGAAKQLGRLMKLGIETAFNVANDAGGIHDRKLALIVADDGYEPTQTAGTMKQLYEKDGVFGIIGNVGTPTAAVALPFSLSHKMLFFGAFTGSNILRRDPPDRYVFNYRPSYVEETSAVVRYLVKTKRLRPEQIAVFAQQDGFGDAGFEGVAKAMRTLRAPGDTGTTMRLNYPRNTVDVDDAIAQLSQYQHQRGATPIKAVVMVATYRAAAKFIEKTHDLLPGLTYTNVSAVGSTVLAEELLVLGPKYAAGVIVTQVVPAVESYASVVLDYKAALAKYFPGEVPDYVSLEGYLTANILIEGLKRTGPQLDTERLVAALENLREYDMGLGTTVSFGRADHQGLHKVWGSQLDATGHYQPIELD
jgi:branched-chain amino acid transport system substrate-binding protein